MPHGPIRPATNQRGSHGVLRRSRNENEDGANKCVRIFTPQRFTQRTVVSKSSARPPGVESSRWATVPHKDASPELHSAGFGTTDPVFVGLVSYKITVLAADNGVRYLRGRILS